MDNAATDLADDPLFANVAPPAGPAHQQLRPDGDQADAKAVIEWIATHRRPDAPAVYPVAGFDNGRVTLWLPSPKTEVRQVVRGGRPVREVVTSNMTAPDMVRLRQRTVTALRSPEGRLAFDVVLAEYAIALIVGCYTADDDELTRLLGGTRWHQNVVEHLLGGTDEVDRLVRTDATLAVAVLFPPVAEPATEPDAVTSTPVPEPVPAAPRRRWRPRWLTAKI